MMIAGPAHGFTVSARTDAGLVRSENEDAVAVTPGRPLWAVADGMGGHVGGAWAAAQVSDAISRVALVGRLDDDCESVADLLADANERVQAEGARRGATIGATVVALLVAEGRYACLWAGDSRLYLLRDGMLSQCSRDHSQVEDLVSAGLITREQARDHPLGNVVTRAIGVVPGLALDVVEDAVRPGDRFLLCSDGLTKVLDDPEIADVLGGGNADGACAELLRRTIANGAPDNVSVVVIVFTG